MSASANEALVNKNRGQGIFTSSEEDELTAEEKAFIAKVS